MQTEPFPPTAQGGRTARATSLEGEPGATASILLATVLYGATIGLGILLYRRLSARTAYLLTIAPAVAATVVAAETLSRAFPAWM